MTKSAWDVSENVCGMRKAVATIRKVGIDDPNAVPSTIF
jgi:hypothetical protein